ncbi:ABC transporter substrate-binding protein [Breoghania sp. JC706]|uniref:ABC transporter substrate-binding protein n=1 Tax=Breoghania sp. JC706 TaxID=3117732 RepID=UPI00300A93A2
MRSPLMIAKATLVALLAATATTAAAPQAHARVVVDQLGREVTVPDEVNRVVVLQHQALDIIVELNGQDKLVGVVRDWPKLLGGSIGDYAPIIKTLPQPGDLKTANVEEVLALKPDVVFMTHYAPAATVESLEKAGIPVVELSFFTAPASESAKLNPSLDDENTAYTDGLVQAVSLIGAVIGREGEANALNDYVLASRKIVADRLKDLDPAERVRLYMANPDLHTYGRGKYTGVFMEASGGANVAADIKGYAKVTMEQVLAWNPQAIVVQSRYEPLVAEIKSDPAWAPIQAVRDDRIYLTPEYVKPWGHPLPESMALGELWMARKLYPDRFADVDFDARVQDFYAKFYRTSYTGR